MDRNDFKIIVNKGKWKPVPIEFDNKNGNDDFEGLVSIEELEGYKIERHNLKRKNDKNEIFEKNKKKKVRNKSKKKNEKNAEMNNDRDDSGDKDKLHPPKSLKPIAYENNKNCDIDMSAWDSLFVPECVIKALRQLKFDSPMPIQSLAIPAAIRDRLDILGASQTGSGKTLAFAIPLIHFIIDQKQNELELNGQIVNKLRALILTPTRELAIQIKKHIENVIKFSNVTVGVVVGGMSVQKQERLIRKYCPDILVATPGRLWELIEDKSIENLNSKVISSLKYFVVDEADRMTEKGHFQELKRLIELLKQNENVKGRQIFVFSATLTLIHDLPNRLKLTKRKNKPNKITQSQKLNALISMLGMRSKHTKVIDLTRHGIGTPNEQILTETKINCLKEEKDLYLYYFVSTCPGRTIVFCNSKDCIRRLTNVLKLLQLNPLVLHADMIQKRRLINLEKFSQSPNAILLASDVAARGLDIPNVDHVVHYQIPRTAEIYIHRSGRTARAYNKGFTLMLCDPKEEAQFYKKLCQTMNKGEDLQLFPIDQSLLILMKQRTILAQKCDQLEHKIRKNKAQSDWFHKAAKQCDIEIDDEIIGLDKNDHLDDELRTLKTSKAQLASLLKKPLVPRNVLTAYITRTGSISVPSKKGKTLLFLLFLLINSIINLILGKNALKN